MSARDFPDDQSETEEYDEGPQRVGEDIQTGGTREIDHVRRHERHFVFQNVPIVASLDH